MTPVLRAIQTQAAPAKDTRRERYLKRWGALKTERSSWDAHWRDLSDNFAPRRSRFLNTQPNKGSRQSTHIINNTPVRAGRVLASGMMAGNTSPARPWFRLTTPDAALAESGNVRNWLHQVEERMRTAFARSNVYNCLHVIYYDLAIPGVAVHFLDEDDEDDMRGYVLPIGSYALANSARLNVDTLYREVSMSVGQLVERFGWDNVSDDVRRKHLEGNVDAWVEVLHVVEPNRTRDTAVAGPKGMPFRSCWMEKGRNEGRFLRESGYQECPFQAPRWLTTGEDVYGTSPAMDGLGDARALQLIERRKAQAIDKIVNPPMVAPVDLQGQRASQLPGDVTYVSTLTGGQRFEPVFQINPVAVQLLEASARQHEERINASMYADLWLMMAETDRRQVTAREVAERHEEKMLQLGPVLERLQDELLDPLIDRAFSILQRRGQLPPPPEELQGQDVKVEYISILAQAQRLLGITGVERLASFAGNLAAVQPSVLDKLNTDEMVDEYASMLGVKPDLVVPDDQVAAKRQAQAEAAQAQQQAEAAAQAAQGAATLSKADMQGDNALTRLMSAVGGPAVGQA